MKKRRVEKEGEEDNLRACISNVKIKPILKRRNQMMYFTIVDAWLLEGEKWNLKVKSNLGE